MLVAGEAMTRTVANLAGFLAGVLFISIVAFFTNSASAASDPPYWGSYVSNGSNVTYTGRGDTGYIGTASGTQKFIMTPAGITKYDWQPVSSGMKASRTVPLKVTPAASMNRLNAAIATTVTDAITVAKPALQTAGRVALRANNVVAIPLTAYALYSVLNDAGIFQDPANPNWLRKNEHDVVPVYPTGSVEVIGYGYGPNTVGASCVTGMNGNIYNSPTDLYAALTACSPTGSPSRLPPNNNTYSSAYSAGCNFAVTGTGGACFSRYGCPSGSPGCSGGGSTAYGGIAVRYRTTAIQCPSGYILQGVQCVKDNWREATDEDVEAAIAATSDANLPKVINDVKAANVPLELPLSTPASLTASPSSITTPESTSVTTRHTPEGTETSTTHKRQTASISSTSSTVNNSTINTAITNNTWITNQYDEVTEENEDRPDPPPDRPDPPPDQTPDECPSGDCEITDPDMPEQPELYEQKYPQGIKGVWEAKQGALAATSFVQGIQSMFPNISGGTCPAFAIPLNIASFAAYGDGVIDVPCWVFQAIGLIMLTTACFCAWWIIF